MYIGFTIRAPSVAFITGMFSIAFIVGPIIGGLLKAKETAGVDLYTLDNVCTSDYAGGQTSKVLP